MWHTLVVNSFPGYADVWLESNRIRIAGFLINYSDIEYSSFPKFGINFPMKEMISEIDQDGNGEISFNEFVWLMTNDIHDDEIEDDIREAFRCFDKDGHGFIPISGCIIYFPIQISPLG